MIFIVGSHTNVGKTCVSAAICKAFLWDYFKLIQAGIPTDSATVEKYAPSVKVYPSGITLQTPASPHIGKKYEKKDYQGLQIPIPSSSNLVIETAGGIFTPIDERYCMVDYIMQFSYPVLVVGNYYVGAINHILLTLDSLRSREIRVLGIVISGSRDRDLDSFIHSYSKLPLAHLHSFSTLAEFEVASMELKKELLQKKIWCF